MTPDHGKLSEHPFAAVHAMPIRPLQYNIRNTTCQQGTSKLPEGVRLVCGTMAVVAIPASLVKSRPWRGPTPYNRTKAIYCRFWPLLWSGHGNKLPWS